LILGAFSESTVIMLNTSRSKKAPSAWKRPAGNGRHLEGVRRPLSDFGDGGGDVPACLQDLL